MLAYKMLAFLDAITSIAIKSLGLFRGTLRYTSIELNVIYPKSAATTGYHY